MAKALKKSPAAKKPSQAKHQQASLPRKLTLAGYQPLNLRKRSKHPGPKLSNSFQLTKAAIIHLFQNKKLFISIVVIYLVLTLIFIRGFIFTADLELAKESITELVSGSTGQLAAAVTVFSVLVGSTSPTSQVGSLYQSVLLVVFSLAIIWTLRQTHAGIKISLKDAFYKSTYPLVPFLLVLVVIGIQLLPLLLASFLYSATIASGISTTAIEVILWLALSFLLVLWTVYMVTSSLFALYIVTLPDMTPIKALRSAKNLVQFRRWTVMRKVLFIPFAIVITGFILVLPVILLFAPVAEVLFLLLSSAILVVIHAYIYALYRELLA